MESASAGGARYRGYDGRSWTEARSPVNRQANARARVQYAAAASPALRGPKAVGPFLQILTGANTEAGIPDKNTTGADELQVAAGSGSHTGVLAGVPGDAPARRLPEAVGQSQSEFSPAQIPPKE